MEINAYLNKWVSKNAYDDVNPLYNIGSIYKIFPHLESLVVKKGSKFYRANGVYKEYDIFTIPFDEETSPADILLNWLIDIEKVKPTEEQIVFFNHLFGSISLREMVFKTGTPLDYLAYLVSSMNMLELNKIKYFQKEGGLVMVKPFYYYEAFPLDNSLGNDLDKIQPIKTMKVINKHWLNKFMKDATFKEDFFKNNPTLIDVQSYKSSFEESGLFNNNVLKNFYSILKDVGLPF